MESSLVSQLDVCITLCRELRDCLVQERSYLIELRMEELAETTMRKEHQIRVLNKKRRLLGNELANRFGSPELLAAQAFLEPADRPIWVAKREDWELVWEQTRELCESNQKFLRHSLKNLSLIADNMKRLLGETPLYSSSGKKKDSPSSGKVLEAQY